MKSMAEDIKAKVFMERDSFVYEMFWHKAIGYRS